jgi:hypothetical protein
VKVDQIRRALDNLLDSDEDLATLYLTAYKETGKRRPLDQHEEAELLLENYVRQGLFAWREGSVFRFYAHASSESSDFFVCLLSLPFAGILVRSMIRLLPRSLVLICVLGFPCFQVCFFHGRERDYFRGACVFGWLTPFVGYVLCLRVFRCPWFVCVLIYSLLRY